MLGRGRVREKSRQAGKSQQSLGDLRVAGPGRKGGGRFRHGGPQYGAHRRGGRRPCGCSRGGRQTGCVRTRATETAFPRAPSALAPSATVVAARGLGRLVSEFHSETLHSPTLILIFFALPNLADESCSVGKPPETEVGAPFARTGRSPQAGGEMPRPPPLLPLSCPLPASCSPP